MRYKVTQRSRPELTYPDLSEKEMEAHKNDINLKGKYIYTPIEEKPKAEVPAEATKVKKDK